VIGAFPGPAGGAITAGSPLHSTGSGSQKNRGAGFVTLTPAESMGSRETTPKSRVFPFDAPHSLILDSPVAPPGSRHSHPGFAEATRRRFSRD
jgi:hypothetical protein